MEDKTRCENALSTSGHRCGGSTELPELVHQGITAFGAFAKLRL
jgi:hypothetical protein